jgi:peptidoglycan/LPS O-acetylase OafA/YrhL
MKSTNRKTNWWAMSSSVAAAPTSWSIRLLSRFRRVTTSGAFISEIDGLRFIAIGTVILFHLVVNLSIKSPLLYPVPLEGNLIVGIARYGFRGVELFFIISGFILAYPFASHYLKGAQPVRLKQYYMRRLTRLEPPYFLCMILFFLARVWLRGETVGQLLPHLGASLIYSHNLIFGGESTINNVAWSLEIEIQFYLLVPILSRLFAVQNTLLRRSIIIGICTISTVHAWLFIGPESILYLTIVRFVHFFLLGFLLSDIFIVGWQEAPKRNWQWDIVSLVGWPLLFIIWNHPELSRQLFPWGKEPAIGAILFPPMAFFMYQAVFRGPATNRIITNPWITTIGGMCYTVYLFHNQLIGVIVLLTRTIAPFTSYSLNISLQAILVIPPMLLACALYFVAIERPCMRKDWPRRFADRCLAVSHGAAARLKSPFITRP